MTRQQINLYTAELRPQTLRYSARFGLLAATATLLTCAALSGYSHWQMQRAVSTRSAAQAELQSWQTRELQLQAQISSIRADQSLIEDTTRTQTRIAATRRVLAYLDQAHHAPEHGYAEYLAGLARRTTNGVWLTRVSIGGRGDDMEIRGAALAPKLLPEFIDALGTETAYRGREFLSLRIERQPDSGGQVAFRLSTHAEEPRDSRGRP